MGMDYTWGRSEGKATVHAEQTLGLGPSLPNDSAATASSRAEAHPAGGDPDQATHPHAAPHPS
jgi:hypothetical protein